MGTAKWSEAERAELVERALEEIASGRSLRSIAGDEGMPSAQRLHDWVTATPALAGRYAQARERRADNLADRVDEAIGKVAAGEMDPQAGRVVIDGLKWLAAKMDPKAYGDRTTHDVNVNVHAAQVEALRSFGGPVLSAPDVIDVTPVEVVADDLDDMLS